MATSDNTEIQTQNSDGELSMNEKKQSRQRLSLCGRLALILTTLCVVGLVARGAVLPSLNDLWPFEGGQRISASNVNDNFDTVVHELETHNTVLQNVAGGHASVAERLAALEGQFAALQDEVTDLQEFKTTVERGECPQGYERWFDEDDPGGLDRATAAWTACRKNLGDEENPVWDKIVKVGDFWIDRYEMADCGDRDLGDDPTGYTTIGVPCSRPGAEPYQGITWYQAAQACTNAGKHLCTNAEWQTAASGTPDPGDGVAVPDGSAANNACNVANNAGQGLYSADRGTPARARAHVNCVSRFGAFDMIGNVWEWVAMWSGASGINEMEPTSRAFHGVFATGLAG